MNWNFCDIVVMLLVLLLVVGIGQIGDRFERRVIEKDAIRIGVGCYSTNRESGEVKFYWVGNGTNVEAYIGGK